MLMMLRGENVGRRTARKPLVPILTKFDLEVHFNREKKMLKGEREKYGGGMQVIEKEVTGDDREREEVEKKW